MSQTDTVTVADIEVDAATLNPEEAAKIYKEHGALVVRGLMRPYVDEMREQLETAARQAIKLYDQGQVTDVPDIGKRTADGTLWLPAPENFHRDWQIMVLGCHYNTSAALLRSAFEPKTISLMTAIFGPNVEIYGSGQCLYKEPVGGHPKELHQDAAYFEHRYEGPAGMLNYAVDTTVEKGALHVVPGSHKLGVLEHVDTFSHLGLDKNQWTWEQALPIEGKAGDSIFFHVNTIHGSKPNTTDSSRPVFIHRYRRSDDYIVINGPTVKDRKLSEKQKDKARKENQYGLMAAGFRPLDMERVENND